MRKIVIAGNWKLNNTPQEAVELINALKSELSGDESAGVIVCPTFLALSESVAAAKGSSIAVGAQNLYWEESGAFTGEVSGSMLKAAGATYAIVGHSERRQFFGETNATVNQRAKAALKNGLKAIVCVGETLEEREAGNAEAVVRDHLTGSLAGLTEADMANVIIAYEPVWAIGTGKTASPAQAQEIHAFARGVLKELFNDNVAQQTTIQYGGSVKPDNAAELLGQEDIDGALVGGASLKADMFAAIVKAGSLEGVS